MLAVERNCGGRQLGVIEIVWAAPVSVTSGLPAIDAVTPNGADPVAGQRASESWLANEFVLPLNGPARRGSGTLSTIAPAVSASGLPHESSAVTLAPLSLA